MKNLRVGLARILLVLPALAVPAALAGQAPADAVQRVDRLFERWTKQTPGCAVAVAQGTKTLLSRAWGMADLEHDIANTPGTIFESGSVAKQFTSAAIVLLSLDGKLALEDDVRKYLPELPAYGRTLTIRHMMTHTSGLRDWGSVAGIAGWPRGQRAHTHAHVIDIVSRQRALNFTPGYEYSYSNTGYNLLAVIVSRVSGTSFAEFSRRRLFEPLGMKDTQWRDDFTRIVRGRAQAYSGGQNGFSIDMPFEYVHGNGGLLTTVGDLLIWTRNLETGQVGGPAFLEAMHRVGVLNDGRKISYASGLMIGPYNGVREVSHTGSTAGYRAFLARYPDQQLSVALLCNVGSVNPGQLGHQVADIYLGNAARPARPQPPQPFSVPADRLAARAGLYRETGSGEPFRLVFADGALRAQPGGALTPVSADAAQFGATARRLTFETPAAGGRPRIRESNGDAPVVVYDPVPEFTPTAEELAAYAGEYHSPDAETTLVLSVENGQLIAFRRPDTRIRFTPVYRDAFEAQQLGLVRFYRAGLAGGGGVTQMSVRQARVYDLRFDRVR